MTLRKSERLSVALVGRHKKLYLPIFILGVVTTTILCSLLAVSYSTLHQPIPDGISPSTKRLIELSEDTIRKVFELIAWTNSILGIGLLLALVRDLVSLRKKELGQLRLIGFTRSQLWWLNSIEVFMIQCVAVAVGLMASIPSTFLVVKLAVLVGFLNDGFMITFGIQPFVQAGILILVSGQVAVALFYLSQRRHNILDSISPVVRNEAKRNRWRFALGLLLVIAVIAALIWAPVYENETTVVSMFLSMAIVLPILLIAPTCIETFARLSESISVRFGISNSGLLRQRFQTMSGKYSRLMLPILLTVGLVGGFFVGANAIYGAEAKQNLEFLGGRYSAVPEKAIDFTKFKEHAVGQDTVKVASYMGFSDADERRIPFVFVDTNLRSQDPLPIVEGGFEAVKGTVVAVDSQLAKKHPLGSTLAILTPDNTELNVSVGAVVNIPPMIGSGVVADMSTFPLHGAVPQVRYVIGEELPQLPGFIKYDAENFVSKLVRDSRTSQIYSNLFLLGFIYVLACLSLSINLREMYRARSQEFAAMYRLGFTWSRIRRLCVLENVMFLVFALVFISVMLGVAYLRVGKSVNSMLGIDIATFPWGQSAAAFCLLALVSLSTTLFVRFDQIR